MQQRRLLTLTLMLLSSSCTLSSAHAEQPLLPEIEIDRSVLQDLKGYEPPPMFGAVKSKPVAAPLNRVPVAPLAAPNLTVPKADALLEFPVKNTEVVTRQRMTAPDEVIAHARPDYSDHNTVLNLTPAVPKQLNAVAEPKKPAKKAAAKAPLPPKKPGIQLASVKSNDSPVAAKPEEKVIIKAEKVAPPQEKPAKPMTPMAAAEKYVPKASPTMPVVKFDPVEKNKLDAFALPLTDDADKEASTPKPTPGERMIDQALTNRITQIDKADIEATVAGGKVATGKKDEPLAMAALPTGTRTASAKIQQVSMEFKPKLIGLQNDQQSTLNSEILTFLSKHNDARLQIQSFAGEPGSDSDARRISLSRALSVRDYLLGKGIEPSRIDVRAMGNNTKEMPADRVDLILIRQN
jgi:outer membrane protein OmpA-like peptidoglycan-associated protein